MMSLVIAGISFIVLGVLIMGTKINRRLEMRTKKSFLMGKIAGNLGEILFIVGIVCLVSGVAKLYYG
ncbi:hypothetical protein H0O02_04140 [Candidatus Micrarchaeota archaeon]|nr:hypothetical protein [Candidatus Micrarchaeota archaeon]